MKAWFKVPLLFVLLGALIGTLLRFHFVFPMKHLHFMNWLHAHSHVMFLGWITNALILAFIHEWTADRWRSFKPVFLILQFVLAGLATSFILQGYGVVSIVFLGVHSLLLYIFCILFLKHTKRASDSSLPFVKEALLFLFLSTLGAFAIGPIAANGLGQSKWYYFAVFFYLHFQYNGFFVFGILGLFFKALERRGVIFSPAHVRKVRLILFYSCFPAYLLSVIWSGPGILVIVLAAIAGVAQVVGLIFLICLLRLQWIAIVSKLTMSMRILLGSALLAFILKTVLQLLSAVPSVARLASDVRFFVLAYLHLVLIGLVTFYLLAWMSERKIIPDYKRGFLYLLLSGFFVSEVVMIATPLLGSLFQVFTVILLVSAIMMALGLVYPLLSRSRDTF